jgi:hypothetical protein
VHCHLRRAASVCDRRMRFELARLSSKLRSGSGAVDAP